MSAYSPGEPCAQRYRVIWYRVPENLIGGPYAIGVIKADGSMVSSVRGIATEAAAIQRAWDYAGSFHTTDVQGVSI